MEKLAPQITPIPWQEDVAKYSGIRSLAIPAPCRSGKNYAVILAASTLKTIIIEPTEPLVLQTMRELRHFEITAKVLTAESFYYETDVTTDVKQIIFNEPLIHKVKLTDILAVRDKFDKKIIVVGTPQGLPCPIFYPLSKIPEWTIFDIFKEYGHRAAPWFSNNEIEKVRRTLSAEKFATQFESRWSLIQGQ